MSIAERGRLAGVEYAAAARDEARGRRSDQLQVWPQIEPTSPTQIESHSVLQQ